MNCLEDQGFGVRAEVADIEVEPAQLVVATPSATAETHNASVQLFFYPSADETRSAVAASEKLAEDAGYGDSLPSEVVGSVYVSWLLDPPQAERDAVNGCISR